MIIALRMLLILFLSLGFVVAASAAAAPEGAKPGGGKVAGSSRPRAAKAGAPLTPAGEAGGEIWGKSVEGVRCSLTADREVWMPGEMSSFKAVIRNGGKRELVVAQAQQLCELEVDGTWYEWTGEVALKMSSLPPGREYGDILVTLDPLWGRKRDRRGGKSQREGEPARVEPRPRPEGTREAAAEPQQLAVEPGEHFVRVAFLPQAFRAAGPGVRVESRRARIVVGDAGDGQARELAHRGERVLGAGPPSTPPDPTLRYYALDLRGVPVRTDYAALPDLFEARPAGSVSYHLRKGIVVLHPPDNPAASAVYYLPGKGVFYVQPDGVGASTLHYHGPFPGDPYLRLGWPRPKKAAAPKPSAPQKDR